MFLKTSEQPKALGYMEAGCSPFHCRLYVYSKKVNFFAWLFTFLGPWAALPDWLDTQYGSGNPLLVCRLLVLHLVCLGSRRVHSLFFVGHHDGWTLWSNIKSREASSDLCIMGVLGEAGSCSWMLSHVGMRARDGKWNGMVGSYLMKAFNETKDI